MCRRRCLLLTLIASCLLPGPLWAEHPPAADNSADAEIIEGLGDYTHAVTTSQPRAQAFFDQGLRLLYAFNHDEAIRAFRTAARIDPQCAMAHWGIALGLGPNYNLEADAERSAAAFQALEQAQRVAGGASPREQAYVAALAKRYASDPQAERKTLDAAYAAAMRQLVAEYPDDQDAAVLFAEAMMDLRPWDLWTPDGKPQPGTDEVVATLERVLRRNPNHPGANHFYIHAVEASTTPQRALPSALRLSGLGQGTGLDISAPLMPAAGHLVHMPSHIYFRLGWYSAAVESNRRAAEVDRRYIARYKPMGVYPLMYYPHNIHFAWAALCMEGRGAEALEAANQVAGALHDDMVQQMPMLEYFLPVRMYTLVRFKRWDDVARQPRPLAEFTFATGMWHYGQGLGCEARGQAGEAQAHFKELETIIAATPADKLVMRHSAQKLLRIAAAELAAQLARCEGKLDAAVSHWRTAVALQDELLYDEPPPWYFPTRQALGTLLLAAKRPAEAEAVFREDLERHPENGWSLHGLERSLRAQDHLTEADQVHANFVRAWSRADFKLPE